MIWIAVNSIGDDNTDGQNGQFVQRQFALADFIPQALQAVSEYGHEHEPATDGSATNGCRHRLERI
jgi:hypothetical protein